MSGKDGSLLQPLNAEAFMVTRLPAVRFNAASAEQFWNALWPKDVTALVHPKVRVERFEHPENAEAPIDVTPVVLSVVMPVHPSKALAPYDAPLPTVRLVMPVHDLNALELMVDDAAIERADMVVFPLMKYAGMAVVVFHSRVLILADPENAAVLLASVPLVSNL